MDGIQGRLRPINSALRRFTAYKGPFRRRGLFMCFRQALRCAELVDGAWVAPCCETAYDEQAAGRPCRRARSRAVHPPPKTTRPCLKGRTDMKRAYKLLAVLLGVLVLGGCAQRGPRQLLCHPPLRPRRAACKLSPKTGWSPWTPLFWQTAAPGRSLGRCVPPLAGAAATGRGGSPAHRAGRGG